MERAIICIDQNRKTVSLSKLYDISIIFLFSSQIFISISSRIFVPFLGDTWKYPIAVMLMYAPCLIYILLSHNWFPRDIFVPITFVLVVYILTVINHPEYETVFEKELTGFWTGVFNFYSGVFGYLFIRYSARNKKIEDNIAIASILLMLWNCWQPVEYIKYGGWVTTTSMSFSYSITFPTIYLLSYGTKKHYIVCFLLGLLGIIEIVVFGSRGSLLCIAVYICLNSVFGKNRKLSFRRILFLVELIILLIILFTVDWSHVITNLGIKSRTLDLINSNLFSSTETRQWIWDDVKYLISTSGFWGYGMLADQYYEGGFYTHNIVLEIILEFGWTIGVLIIVFLLYNAAKFLVRCNDEKWLNLFIIFISCSIKLLVSSSFWYDMPFWATIGIAVSYYKEYKQAKHMLLKNKKRSKWRLLTYERSVCGTTKI